ncbi:MAG: glycosyltransferase [Gemmatimonadaceae bacterium]
MRPAVSIVLPTHDRLAMLEEAVASVQAQTFADWELIVVDDGSTDGTGQWLESLNEPRLVVIRLARDGNISRVRNAGVARARGQWVALLDSDDRWHPQKLDRQLRLHADNPQLRWSYTGRRMVDAGGVPLPPSNFRRWQPHAGDILRPVLTLEANIAAPSVMVERALLLEAGSFDDGWPRAGDYELWLRLAERAPCGVVDEPLVDVRSHKGTTYGLPDVNVGLADMYRSFAARTSDAALRRIAERREATHSVNAANIMMQLGRWHDARAATLRAVRRTPTEPFVYRALARLAFQRLLALGR